MTVQTLVGETLDNIKYVDGEYELNRNAPEHVRQLWYSMVSDGWTADKAHSLLLAASEGEDLEQAAEDLIDHMHNDLTQWSVEHGSWANEAIAEFGYTCKDLEELLQMGQSLHLSHMARIIENGERHAS